MKRFMIFVFAASFVFVGLGALVDGVKAKFKSDEKALEIIRSARAALGGEAKLREIRGLIIVGKSTQSHNTPEGAKSIAFDTEIALQYPDKIMKRIDVRGDAAGLPRKMESHEVSLVRKAGEEKTVAITGKDGEFKTSDGQVFKVRKGSDGVLTTEDGKKVVVHTEIERVPPNDGETKVFVRKPADGTWKTEEGKVVELHEQKMKSKHEGLRDNQFLRTTLGILLTAPEGMDVSYTFAGEGDVDGTAADIVNAEFGGQNFKLYIGKANNLPLAIGYVGHPMPEVVHFEHKVPAPADGAKDVVMFKRHDGSMPRRADCLVKFADFRDVGGLQLPYKWTTTAGGQVVDVFDITAYDINPVNIAEKFADQKTKVRMKKDGI